MASLPHDIFSHIVEEFSPYAPEELNALKSLSLSCNDLLPLCQKVIFRRIEFNHHPPRRIAITRLDDILKESPHIASYVLFFSYSLTRPDTEDGTISIIAHILSSLDRLTGLNLHWRPSSRHFPPLLDWTSFRNDPRADEFYVAVETVLRREHLSHLNVRSIKDFPFYAFTHRSELLDVEEEDYLCIRMTIVEHATGLNTSPYANVRNYSAGRLRWPRRMMEVVLDGQVCLQSSGSAVPPFNFASAEGLVMCVTKQMHAVEAERILRCGQSIKQLSYEVACSSGLQGFGNAILAGSFRTLTTLQIILATEPVDDDPFQGFCEELNHISGRNILEYLELEVSLDLNDCPLGEHHLKRLDSAVRRTGFPCLTTFDLIFRISQRSPWDDTAGPQPTMEDLENQHLAHLGTLRAIDGLDCLLSFRKGH
ncbi:hypothetical protein GALMADRAFT_227280 [Galerina marginata CBS 339.88]|uniref:F-box domain-containing protein n=1 Tax=Galerina marginata (strain CBS 339.88) TaxID=685588 RepID=A0A067T7K7_GALM3|nr:hypothetical protein GALMADRAFT_227280 [Galerina marginata CBS 339.88]